ncbi:hypothetical protein M758_N018900 [Ceratodon purpureus]|nr:hypothetical protein M758_N018900 [Ceratodon purpureus]
MSHSLQHLHFVKNSQNPLLCRIDLHHSFCFLVLGYNGATRVPLISHSGEMVL